tara:strand:- start:1504 stop:1662 length:159 start_codon:yes stop_codon:yes gene_type:complete
MVVKNDSKNEYFIIPKETPERFKENNQNVIQVEFVDFEGKRVVRTYEKKVNK